jgi:hypothetical protein
MVDSLASFVSGILGEREAPKVPMVDFADCLASSATRTRITKPIRADSLLGTYDFGKMCAWEEILCARHGVTRTRQETAKDRWTFGIGKAYHYMLQNEMFVAPGTSTTTRDENGLRLEVSSSREPLFLGWWKCEGCARVEAGVGEGVASWIHRPLECPKCGWDEFSYFEPDHRREGFRSHSDGGILWNGKVYHLEFKATNAFNFRKVYATPMPEHLVQVALNKFTSGAEQSLLVYLNYEEPVWKKAVVTHEVKRDEDFIRKQLFKARQIREWIGDKRSGLPKRGGVCLAAPVPADCPRAKKCAVAEHCPIHSGSRFV